MFICEEHREKFERDTGCPYCRERKLEATIAEHEQRWRWLSRSILAISGDGYPEWASVVLAVVNKCRYEPLEEKKV